MEQAISWREILSNQGNHRYRTGGGLSCHVILSRYPVTLSCHVILSRYPVTLSCHVILSRYPVTLSCQRPRKELVLVTETKWNPVCEVSGNVTMIAPQLCTYIMYVCTLHYPYYVVQDSSKINLHQWVTAQLKNIFYMRQLSSGEWNVCRIPHWVIHHNTHHYLNDL